MGKAQYMRHDTVVAAKQALMAENFLAEYRELCQEIIPVEVNKDEYIRVKDTDLVSQTGNLNGVPHHISTMHEILGMLKGTRDLFEKIGKPPGVVTVATSRRD